MLGALTSALGVTGVLGVFASWCLGVSEHLVYLESLVCMLNGALVGVVPPTLEHRCTWSAAPCSACLKLFVCLVLLGIL